MFDHCLYFNTTALARQLEREWVAAFAPLALTPPQAFMLRAVLDQPGMAHRDIADKLVLARPTATRALDGLAAKGLVERRASEADGREFLIYPTGEAVAIRKALNEASGDVTRRLKKLLSEETFTDTVTKIRDVRSALT